MDTRRRRNLYQNVFDYFSNLVITTCSMSFWNIILPLVQFSAVILISLVCSSIFYYLLYTYLVPKALLREPIYFDFTLKQPQATIDLLSTDRQWYYTKSNNKNLSHFLRSRSFYSFEVYFELAKSIRNYDIGKFVLSLTIIDTAGESIAKSMRPVVLPFRSPATLFLESLVSFPTRLFGFSDNHESVSLTVLLMENYMEPSSFNNSSRILDLRISEPNFDVTKAYINVMPKLYGITYFLYYHPITCGAIGVLGLTSIQFGIFVALYMIIWAIKAIRRYLTNRQNIVHNTAGYTPIAPPTTTNAQYINQLFHSYRTYYNGYNDQNMITPDPWDIPESTVDSFYSDVYSNNGESVNSNSPLVSSPTNDVNIIDDDSLLERDNNESIEEFYECKGTVIDEDVTNEVAYDIGRRLGLRQRHVNIIRDNDGIYITPEDMISNRLNSLYEHQQYNSNIYNQNINQNNEVTTMITEDATDNSSVSSSSIYSSETNSSKEENGNQGLFGFFGFNF